MGLLLFIRIELNFNYMSDNANKYVNLENLTYYTEQLINTVDNKINDVKQYDPIIIDLNEISGDATTITDITNTNTSSKYPIILEWYSTLIEHYYSKNTNIPVILKFASPEHPDYDTLIFANVVITQSDSYAIIDLMGYYDTENASDIFVSFRFININNILITLTNFSEALSDKLSKNEDIFKLSDTTTTTSGTFTETQLAHAKTASAILCGVKEFDKTIYYRFNRSGLSSDATKLYFSRVYTTNGTTFGNKIIVIDINTGDWNIDDVSSI